MTKENQRVAITKRMLKEALLRLLKRKEIEKISITELCREADVNRATFYRHYTVPQDLLIDIETDMIKNSPQLSDMLKSLQEAKLYLVKLFTYVYENADMIRLLIRSNSEQVLAHVLDVFYQNVLQILHSRKEELPDRDSVRLASTYLAGGGYYLVRQWLTEDIQKTPEEIAELVFLFFSRNIGSEESKPLVN